MFFYLAIIVSLRITEIFYSLQGETRTVGLPTVFIRLTGCPLRCVWCDTEYSFQGGERWTLDDILATVKQHKTPHVTVTGGEPLAQPNAIELIKKLCDLNYSVSIETSGALSIADIDERADVVMDLKAPDSGESHRNLWDNIPLLKQKDQVKFVIASRKDYDWVRLKVDELNLVERVGEVLFSPVWGQLEPSELAEWILADQLPVRFQLQLHKVLWNDAQGR